jgi:hypothetical protein
MTTWRLGPYRAVGHRFVVEGVDADLVRDRLNGPLEPLLDPSPALNKDVSTYQVLDRGSQTSPRYRVRFGSRTLTNNDNAASAASYVFWHVNQSVVRIDRGEHLILHAGGVQKAGVTVALPAPMESGKTTTTAGLLRAGYGYLTDEALVIDRTTWQITPYPKPLSLDMRSIDVLGGLPAPDHVHAEFDEQWQVPWWTLGSAGVPGRARPDLLIFPKFRPGKRTELTRAPSGEAVMLLAGSTFEFTRRPRRNLELLAKLVEAMPAFRLIIGDLGEAVGLIDSMVDEVGSCVPDGRRRSA